MPEEEKIDKPGNEETEKVKLKICPKCGSEMQRNGYQQIWQCRSCPWTVRMSEKVRPMDKDIVSAYVVLREIQRRKDEKKKIDKPNWMAIRMSVLTGDRTKAELRKCDCDQCNLALKFMADAGE